MANSNLHSERGYSVRASRAFGSEHLHRKRIERDMDIRGCVYYGTGVGEAIVVDPEKYPDEYERYYKIAKDLATTDGQVVRTKVPWMVFETVAKEMTYSQEGVDRLLQTIAHQDGLSKLPEGAKVELSDFMYAGVGVCRHHALICAVLLEMFKSEGYIMGDISVDSNSNERVWCRYTGWHGQVMILDFDAKRNYCGLLREVEPVKRWNYFRDEEKQYARMIGATGLNGQSK